MQRQLHRVGVVVLAAFVAVFAQLNYLQIFAAEEIASHDANIRRLIAEYSIRRGDILTLDGETIATSKATRNRLKFQRVYPGGDLYGHITGWYSIFFGADRIERSFNDQLLGESKVLSMQDIEDRFLGSGEQGDDVRLTIDSRLQEAARAALGDQQGSVVAIDPQTGEVRALWSNPSFDPGPLASHDPKIARAHWKSLRVEEPGSPVVNRAAANAYPPGSTFKVVTAAAALESGEYRSESTFPDPVELELPLTDETLMNFTRTSCAGGTRINLFDALRISCDTTFGMLGLRLPEDIRSMAEKMGFNQDLDFDIALSTSTYPELGDDEAPLRAYAAIGQGDNFATPLQMGLVTATVATGGDVPRLRLVREVIDANGSIVESYDPESIGRAMSPATAAAVTEMMLAVVQSGTGTAAQIPGVTVAGKTGTAQTGVQGAAPHAWFICFAPAEDPRLAVAVLVENGGSFGSEATGGAVAAPIAKQLLEVDRSIRGW